MQSLSDSCVAWANRAVAGDVDEHKKKSTALLKLPDRGGASRPSPTAAIPKVPSVHNSHRSLNRSDGWMAQTLGDFRCAHKNLIKGLRHWH